MAPFLPPRPQNLSQAGHLLEFPAHYYHKFVYFQKFEGHFPSALTQHKLRETRESSYTPLLQHKKKNWTKNIKLYQIFVFYQHMYILESLVPLPKEKVCSGEQIKQNRYTL